jgi:hypothetical protein
MIAHELHSDGSQEDKLFAPGYGEFRTAGDGDLEALALAVPADALAGRAPRELRALIVSARAILESARVEDWETASASLRRTKLPWGTLREGHLPQSISGRLSKTMRALTLAVRAHKPARVAQAAIDVEQSALDLQLRHRPVVEIDKRRFELWTQQLRVHAAANDLAGATGDVAVLEWIRDRFVKTLERGRREELAMRLRDLRRATDARNLPAAADHAARLAALLRA